MNPSLGLVLILAAPSPQTDELPGVEADEKTIALLERTEALTYLLSAEGVRKASVTGKAKVESPGAPPRTCEFRYEWDGRAAKPRGKVILAPGDRALKGKLPDPGILDSFFVISPRSIQERGGVFETWREDFAGCKLATSKEEGRTTIRVVDGESRKGYTAVTLNADGMPGSISLSGDGRPPGARIELAYAKVGSRFALSKLTGSAAGNPMVELAVEFGKAGKHTVPVMIKMSSFMSGKAETTSTAFADWELDDSGPALRPEQTERPQASKAKVSSGKPGPRSAQVENAPSEEEALKLARAIERSISEGDTTVFDEAVDADAFFDRMVGPATLSDPLREILKRLFPAPVLGFNMMSGELMSESLRRMMMPGPRMLSRLNQLKAPAPGDLAAAIGFDEMKTLGDLFQQGKYDEVIDYFEKHSESFAGRKSAHLMRLQAAVRVGPEEQNRAIAAIEKAFPGDPSLKLVSIDAHLNRNELDKALECISNLDEALGGDPYLLVLRANIHLRAGRTGEARRFAARATKEERRLDGAWLALAEAGAKERDFKETVRCLTVLEKELSRKVDVAKTKGYEEFIQSDEYRSWLKEREAR